MSLPLIKCWRGWSLHNQARGSLHSTVGSMLLCAVFAEMHSLQVFSFLLLLQVRAPMAFLLFFFSWHQQLSGTLSSRFRDESSTQQLSRIDILTYTCQSESLVLFLLLCDTVVELLLRRSSLATIHEMLSLDGWMDTIRLLCQLGASQSRRLQVVVPNDAPSFFFFSSFKVKGSFDNSWPQRESNATTGTSVMLYRSHCSSSSTTRAILLLHFSPDKRHITFNPIYYGAP